MKPLIIVRTGPLSNDEFKESARATEEIARFIGAGCIFVQDLSVPKGEWKFSSLAMPKTEMNKTQMKKLHQLLKDVTLDGEVLEVQEEIILIESEGEQKKPFFTDEYTANRSDEDHG